jgi:hypothetical protein
VTRRLRAQMEARAPFPAYATQGLAEAQARAGRLFESLSLSQMTALVGAMVKQEWGSWEEAKVAAVLSPMASYSADYREKLLLRSLRTPAGIADGMALDGESHVSQCMTIDSGSNVSPMMEHVGADVDEDYCQQKGDDRHGASVADEVDSQNCAELGSSLASLAPQSSSAVGLLAISAVEGGSGLAVEDGWRECVEGHGNGGHVQTLDGALERDDHGVGRRQDAFGKNAMQPTRLLASDRGLKPLYQPTHHSTYMQHRNQVPPAVSPPPLNTIISTQSPCPSGSVRVAMLQQGEDEFGNPLGRLLVSRGGSRLIATPAEGQGGKRGIGVLERGKNAESFGLLGSKVARGWKEREAEKLDLPSLCSPAHRPPLPCASGDYAYTSPLLPLSPPVPHTRANLLIVGESRAQVEKEETEDGDRAQAEGLGRVGGWRYEVLRPRSERGVVLGGVGVQDMGNPDQKPKQMHACEPPCWDKQVALAVDVVREAVLMLGSAGSCTAKAVAGNLASMSPAYSRLASGLSLQDVLALVLVPLLPSFPLRIAPPPACKSCVLLLNLVASRPLAPIQHSEPFRAQHEPRPLIHP